MRQRISSTAMRYLSALAATTVVCLTIAFAFNALVDPLWYFAGNRFAPLNFAFNERLSKVNLINGHVSDYDCVIFGDSRVTLLPERKIQGHKCFNFAFSAGEVDEFVSYAQWLKARGFSPRLVIVGVSAGNFRKRALPHNVPDFIDTNENPPSAYIKYLSLDVIAMSWRTLFGTTPIDRVYDRNFQCGVAVTTLYDPHKPIRDVHSGPFDAREPLAQYRKLREIFPTAEFVGYTPPISAWAIDDYNKINWLFSYTRALIDAAAIFDRFIDASVPSSITIDPKNTYDGTHYASDVNAEIAETLLSGDVAPALDLKTITLPDMLSIYRERLNTYSGAIAAGVAALPSGNPTTANPHAQ